MRFRWTSKYLAFLKRGYQSQNVRDLTRAFNQRFGTQTSEGQLKAALKNHHITCGRKGSDRLINHVRLFTPEQCRFIRANYAGRTAEMTTLFNDKFKIAMTPAQIKTFVHNRGITSGRTGYFPKGGLPWNTGTKGATFANKTSFKKGNVPSNRQPLGHERVCTKDGYVLIKVAERNPHTGFPTRYKHKHVHIWEQAHGPVPDGYVVIFRDGNKLHIDLSNLMLVTRAELLGLNKHGYKEYPEELKPSVMALSKLETKTFSIRKGAKIESSNEGA